MEQAFVNVLFAEPPRILWRQLLPLRLGHYYLLEMIESPFADGRPATRADLALAVWICTRTYAQGRRDIRRPERYAFRSRLWGALCSHLDMDHEAARLHEYVTAYTAYPTRRVWDDEKTTPYSLPMALCVAWELAERMPIDEVWELPMVEALTYHAASQHEKGAKFRSRADREETERLQRLAEEVNNGRQG